MIRKYAYVNAKVKARRSLRLSEEFFQTLQRARSLQEAAQLFRDTPYRSLTEVYNETGDLRLAEKELLRLETALFTDIWKALPPEVEAFSRALFLRYEVDSVKFALRLWFAQSIRGGGISRQVGYFLPVRIAYDPDFTALLNASGEEEALAALGDTPYEACVAGPLSRCRREDSLFSAEWSLDRYYYFQLLENLRLLGRRDRRQAADLVRHMIDRQNLLTLLLFRSSGAFPREGREQFFLEGGRGWSREEFVRAFGLEDLPFREALQRRFPRLPLRGTSQDLPVLFERMEQDLNRLSRRFSAEDPFALGVVLSWYLSGRRELERIRHILNDKYYEGGS